MTAVVTSDGQLTLPRELCEELGLTPGQTMEICSEGDRLVAWKKSEADSMGKWLGRGELNLGESVDKYLSLARDGDSR